MKLGKIRFAMLINWLSRNGLHELAVGDIQDLDDLIDIEVPVNTNKVAEEDVNDLLRQINNPDGFINAIKAYRVLTSAGLKESKEAIERYRIVNKTS